MKTAVVICPECCAPMRLRETTKYRDRKGAPAKFFGCSRYPSCTATHAAHSDGRPMGKPGTPEVKAARVRAHDAFDAMWQGGNMARNAAYRWMQRAMGLARDEAHIGMFDVVQCERLIQLVGEYWKGQGR
jgi:hypothetical protein